MDRILSRLVPAGLRRLDQHLLLNHPRLWVTRVHYVLFYSLLASAALGLYAAFRPLWLSDLPNPDVGLAWLIVLACAGLAFWGWQAYAYRDQYGAGQGRWYWLGAAALAAGPVVYSSILTWRLDERMSVQELRADVDALNQGMVYFFGDEIGPGEEGERYFYSLPRIDLYNIYQHEPEMDQWVEKYYDRFLAADAAQHLAYIEQFRETYARYAGEEVPVAVQTVWHAFRHREEVPRAGVLNLNQVENELYLLDQVKGDRLALQKSQGWVALLFATGWIALGFSLFRALPFRTFLLAFGLGFGSVILWVFGVEVARELLRNFGGRIDEDFWIPFGGLVLFGLMVPSVLRQREDAIHSRRQLLGASIFTLAMPMVPLTLLYLLDEGIGIRVHILNTDPEVLGMMIVLGGSLVLSALGWHFLAAPRLQAVAAGPQNR